MFTEMKDDVTKVKISKTDLTGKKELEGAKLTILDSEGKVVEIFGNVGEEFDPNFHNAVMHMEDENLGENVISQVFQKGFKLGEKIIRFARVQVAN